MGDHQCGRKLYVVSVELELPRVAILGTFSCTCELGEALCCQPGRTGLMRLYPLCVHGHVW